METGCNLQGSPGREEGVPEGLLSRCCWVSGYPGGHDPRGEGAVPLESGLQGTRAGCRGQKTKASNVRSSLVTCMWTDRPADSGLDQTHRQAETGGPDRCADSGGRKREGTKYSGQQPSGEAAGHVRSCTVTDNSDRTAPETQRSGCPAGLRGGQGATGEEGTEVLKAAA